MSTSTTQDGPLVGKTALVTGASRGVGRAIAQRLAAAGSTVIISARNLAQSQASSGSLAETASLIESAGGIAIPLAADLDEPQGAKQLVACCIRATGGFQILVHVAGLTRFRAAESSTRDQFGLTVEHCFRVPLTLTAAAKPVMKARSEGWIINVGATASPDLNRCADPLRQIREQALYDAAHLALFRLTKAMAAELEHHNIAVNLALPSTPIRLTDEQPLGDAATLTEPVDYLADTVLSLCHVPVQQRTGTVIYSQQDQTTNRSGVFRTHRFGRNSPLPA
ncbi:MAG: SDR family NAD(P)-dependent oxidoreductase [Pseudomonadota bacterium]|nr:SDR family NAD(P)-dependent oxidoreductase [Pseudomonadota bacterium]